MKNLLFVALVMSANLSLSQTFKSILIDSAAQNNIIFKKDFFKNSDFDQLTWNNLELSTPGIMITPNQGDMNNYYNMPCIKPEYHGKMPCLVPELNSLMPIINPYENRKYALIKDFK